MDLSKLREAIIKELQDDEITLSNIEYLREDNNNFLRVTIDKIDGVDIDTCVYVTKKINSIIDELDIIKDSYILDVTSKERGEN